MRPNTYLFPSFLWVFRVCVFECFRIYATLSVNKEQKATPLMLPVCTQINLNAGNYGNEDKDESI